MIDQVLWTNEEELKVHNFDQEELVAEDEVAVQQLNTDFDTEVAEVVPEPEPVVLEEKRKTIVPEEPEPIKKEEPLPDDLQKHKRMLYCLPAERKIIEDELYGEKRISVQYLDPFRFEAIPVHDDGFQYQCWTNLELGEASIIYVGEDRRWWRVEVKEEKEHGWLLTCIPSDEKPHFK